VQITSGTSKVDNCSKKMLQLLVNIFQMELIKANFRGRINKNEETVAAAEEFK
jgi:hypothetical protein